MPTITLKSDLIEKACEIKLKKLNTYDIPHEIRMLQAMANVSEEITLDVADFMRIRSELEDLLGEYVE